MPLDCHSLSAAGIARPDIGVRVRSATVTVVANDFARYLELAGKVSPPHNTLMILNACTGAHLDSPSCVHVCEADFEIRKHARPALILWLSTSAKEPREHVVRVSAALLLGLVLLEPLLPISVIDTTGLP